MDDVATILRLNLTVQHGDVVGQHGITDIVLLIQSRKIFFIVRDLRTFNIAGEFRRGLLMTEELHNMFLVRVPASGIVEAKVRLKKYVRTGVATREATYLVGSVGFHGHVQKLVGWFLLLFRVIF